MPILCQCCGHMIDAKRRDGVVDRMGLVVSLDPPRAFLRSKALPVPSPTQLRFLFLLVRWGEVAADTLSEATRSEAVMPVTVHVHISRLKDWLEEHGVPIVIEPIKTFGYRLARPAMPLGDAGRIKRAFAEAGEV